MDSSLSSTTSSPSIPSPSTFQDIKLRDCKDCRTEDYTRLPSGELQLNISLCSLHRTTLLATPTRKRSRPLSPSPTNVPTTLPGATQAVIPSRRGGATPPDTDNARLVRSVVTPTRPSSSSSPPPSRRRLNTDETYSRSSVAGEALSSYNRVHRDFANRPDTSISLSKFLKQKRIPERSFYRKKKIAELIILDRPRFDSLIKQILKEERTDRINQQILSDRCGTILKQSDFLEKKRLAIAAGKIL